MRTSLILAATLLFHTLTGVAQSPINLMIEVHVDSASQASRNGAQLWADRQGAGLQGFGQAQTRSGSSDQRVLVMDGGQATIRVGSTRPLRLRQIQRGPWGEVVAEQIVYRALGSGFKVRPHLMGDRVAIDILASAQESGGAPDQVNAFELSTTVNGRLGEWIALGDSQTQQQDAADATQGQRILLRVDLAQ